jgi:hypothetical protein
MGRNGNSGHRVIDWLNTAKKNLESFRAKVGMAKRFECAACGLAWLRKHLGGCYNYEPPPELSSRMIAPACYAICEKCKETLSPKVIYKKATARLAAQGLFK